MELAWITGANGLIGRQLCNPPPDHVPDWWVRGLTRADVDLTDFAAVRQLFQREQPRLIVHCAALSKSTACQADPALARMLNVEVTRFLAELAADIAFFFSPPTLYSMVVRAITTNPRPSTRSAFTEKPRRQPNRSCSPIPNTPSSAPR